MIFKPSSYQVDIYKTFNQTKNDILIQAVAGSGKSTTIIEMANQAKGKVHFLAFNKSIVDELKTKVSSSVEVSTLHSLGLKSIVMRFGRVDIDKNKTLKLVQKTNSYKWKLPKKEFEKAIMVIPRLVDLYRLTLSKTKEQLEQIAIDVGLDFKEVHLIQSMEIIDQLSRYNKAPTSVDFTDMVYLPAIDESIKLTNPDITFIDECQDLNNAQHVLVDKMTVDKRAVFVGDKFQAIYGFAGANTESFDKIKKRVGIIELPLSVSYRCPVRVIDHANKVYPIIECWNNAKEGEVRWGSYSEALSGDMIICRNLKPLIGVFFELIIQNKKAFIKGKDIGQSLIRLIKTYESLSIDQLIENLRKKLHNLINELFEKGIDKPTNHPRYTSLLEKVSSVKIVAKHYSTVKKMLIALEKMFAESGEGVVLSTIHKAKGLESNVVFFLNKHLIPSRFATTPEQLTQERNLMYVGITRSKEKLIYTKYI